MGLKDNFKQAAKELMDTPVRQQEEESYSAPNSGVVTQTRPSFASAPQRTYGQEETYQPASEQTTIIAAGTIIRGSVQTENNLDLYGEVQGDILGQGNLTLRGRLTGNAIGSNMDLRGIRIKGNLRSTGVVMMDDNSVVQGDVQAQELILNGKVEGNVAVGQRLALENNGVILGDVSAARLVVADGGVLQGQVHIGSTQANKVITTQEQADQFVAEQRAQQEQQPEQPDEAPIL